MTEALPIGIITNTENISSDIEAIDRVDVEDLAQLWRVYSTNRVLLPHDAGRRLENLFWRILSNARIHQSIRGSTIARLFLHISEGSDFLRTTPTQSPRGNRSGDSGRLSPSPTPPRVTIQEDHVGATSADSDLEIRRTTRQPSDPSRQALPPPILKKPRAGSDEPPKTARIISPTQTCFDYSWSPAARKTPTSPPPVAESSGAGKNNGKKKTSFTASTVTSRRRPAVTKRKSSQSSTGSSTASPRLQAETAAPFRPELSPRLQEETAAPFQPDPSLISPVVAPTQALRGTGTAPAAVRHVFSLSPPAESWQDVESSDISSFRMPSVDESTVAQSFTGDQPTDWLVDKDFRSRFVDRQRQILSDINLSRMNPDGSGTGAIQGGPGKEKGKEKLRQSSLGGSGQSKPSFASKAAVPDADEDDDDDEEDEDEDEDEEGEEDEDDDKGEDEDEDEEEGPALPLPRTKSQLSLMIERERRASADNGKGKAKEQPRKTSS